MQNPQIKASNRWLQHGFGVPLQTASPSRTPLKGWWVIRENTRRQKKNLPASLLATAQKRAIPIKHALPPTSNAPPLPTDVGNILRPLLAPYTQLFLSRGRLVLALEPTQRARVTAEVLLVLVVGHDASQDAAHGNHAGGVGAHEEGAGAARVGVGCRDDAAQGVGGAVVQRWDRLAVHGRD